MSDSTRGTRETSEAGGRMCARCKVRPVYRSDQPDTDIYGRFCQGCIDRCHDDTAAGHWCAIDRWAAQIDRVDRATDMPDGGLS